MLHFLSKCIIFFSSNISSELKWSIIKKSVRNVLKVYLDWKLFYKSEIMSSWNMIVPAYIAKYYLFVSIDEKDIEKWKRILDEKSDFRVKKEFSVWLKDERFSYLKIIWWEKSYFSVYWGKELKKILLWERVKLVCFWGSAKL